VGCCDGHVRVGEGVVNYVFERHDSSTCAFGRVIVQMWSSALQMDVPYQALHEDIEGLY